MKLSRTLAASAAIAFAGVAAQAQTQNINYDKFCIETPYDFEGDKAELEHAFNDMADMFDIEIDVTSKDIKSLTAYDIDIQGEEQNLYILFDNDTQYICEMDETGYNGVTALAP